MESPAKEASTLLTQLIGTGDTLALFSSLKFYLECYASFAYEYGIYFLLGGLCVERLSMYYDL
jgi:hypothetical protein